MANRRRWVYLSTGEVIEVSQDYCGAPRANTDAILYNDRAYQDMGDQRFTSRTQHREFMKNHGLTDVGDYKQEWRDRENQRMDVRAGVDRSRKEFISQAIHKLTGA